MYREYGFTTETLISFIESYVKVMHKYSDSNEYIKAHVLPELQQNYKWEWNMKTHKLTILRHSISIWFSVDEYKQIMREEKLKRILNEIN